MESGESEERLMDDIDWSQWDKIINEKKLVKVDAPPNAITSRMFAERIGVKKSRATEILRDLVADGLAERYGSGNSFFYVLK